MLAKIYLIRFLFFGGIIFGNGIVFNNLFQNKEKIQNTNENQNMDKMQDKKGTMLPAWYPYFNPKKTNINIAQNQTLLFENIENNENNEFLHYELTNISPKDITLPTQDGSLLMIREGKNPQGKWQAIEYWRYDWGFSPNFSPFLLKSKEKIFFTAPIFTGNFKTEMRFKLKLDAEKDIFITSPTFKGSVDESQFYLPAKCANKKWDGFATK